MKLKIAVHLVATWCWFPKPIGSHSTHVSNLPALKSIPKIIRKSPQINKKTGFTVQECPASEMYVSLRC